MYQSTYIMECKTCSAYIEPNRGRLQVVIKCDDIHMILLDITAVVMNLPMWNPAFTNSGSLARDSLTCEYRRIDLLARGVEDSPHLERGHRWTRVQRIGDLLG
jgi:hypothetical protein